MFRSILRVQPVLLAFTLGCSEADPGSTSNDTSAPQDTAVTSQDTGATVDTSDTAATTATLHGVIDRSTEPAAGGIGNLYVVVMDENPMTGGGNAVGAVVIDNTDFTGADATYSYTITDIPPSTTELFVTAFLDDNSSADADNPGPDQGDLVAMEGISFPTVVMDQAATYEMDITLSLSMPF